MITRQRKCRAKGCGRKFRPNLTDQRVCSPQCGILYGRELKLKADRRKLIARKKGLRTKADLLRLAQTQFNAYIRLRDSHLPCVSCGRWHQGQWHAGHYRPVGGRSGNALRFEEDNCQRQCSVCNNHRSGQLTDYRIELIRRIGIERVEWLEGPHPDKSYDAAEIEEIRTKYRNKTKELAKELNSAMDSTPI